MKEEKVVDDVKNLENVSQTVNAFLDKDLEAALDSFDNLFCRRCLVRNIFLDFFMLHRLYHQLLRLLSIVFYIGRSLTAGCTDVHRILSFQ